MNNKNKEQVLIKGLRETLKDIMLNEIEKLPEYLDGLETKDKVNAICKLMPFVFPRVQAVHLQGGEPKHSENF